MTKILVVEDEALIADDIQRTLSRFGYDVPTPVATAAEALDAVAHLRPDLVLIDIKLRGPRDGIDAGAEIRTRFGRPIIYLTSQSDDATLARAKETRPHGYLLKPFNERELRIAVEVALHNHELESRLAVRERWFSTTLRSIGDAVIATDQDEVITFMNVVAERLTGWGAEAIGRPLGEVFSVVDKSGNHVETPLRVANATAFVVEIVADRKLVIRTGAEIPIDESVAPIIDDSGAVLGGVVVFRDITEHRRLEQRIAHSERLAAIGTMAVSMAHEINNPLAYVTANLSVSIEGLARAAEDARALMATAADREPGDRLLSGISEMLEALKDAEHGAERVRRIVLTLRKMGRADDVSRKVLDLPDVLDLSLKMTDHATRHHARVRKALGTTPFVLAGESELGQVFTNLLVNAAQAIGEGRADSNEIVVATFTDAAGRAVVQFSDTGPGIPKDVLPRIFDPFFTTKASGAGTGLGLSICHSIVTALGGEITATSSAAGGAVFTVSLPAAQVPRTAAAAGASEAPAGRRGKLLIIDDEQAVALALSRGLKRDHDVRVLADGREALELIARGERFDVIFCDLMMPNFGGMDVHEALSRTCPEQAQRMVFMTGGAFSQRAERFLESLGNVQIAKPFAFETVRAIVRDFVKD